MKKIKIKVKPKLNWDDVWQEFTDWHEDSRKHCDKCHHVLFTNADEWDVQQLKIQEIVEKKLKEMKK